MTWLTNPYRFGGPVTGVHRYWETVFHGAVRNSVTLNEIEMAASVGGANLLGSATKSSSPIWVGTLPEITNGQDYGTATFYGCHPNYFRADFGAPVAIGAVRIRAADHVQEYADAPTSFTVRGSDDGITWTSYALCMIPTAWTRNAWQEFAVSAEPLPVDDIRAWGITINSNNGDANTTLREMEFAAVASGADLCTGGYALFSSAQNNTETGNQLFDNNNATLWYMTGASGFILGYVFPAHTLAAEVRLTPFSTLAMAPASFDIWHSHDAVTKTIVASKTSAGGWTNNVARAFSIP